METEANQHAPAEAQSGTAPEATSGGERGSGHGSERRVHARFEIDSEASLLLVGQGLTIPARVTELSQEGCRIRTRRRLALGAQLRVELVFRVNGLAFRLAGMTQWNNGWNLLGIRFISVPAWRAADLAEVIAELHEEMLARVTRRAQAELVAQNLSPGLSPAAQPQTLPHPSESLFAGQSRQSIHAVADPPIVHAAGGRPCGAEGPSERRAYPRHMVDTFASIILIQSGSRLSGWVLDLSLDGCRIRTDARFPADVYTRVETEFRVDGLPFRLAGMIQAIHDRKLVGIHFLGVSERKNTQLIQLMAEIETRQGSGSRAQFQHPLVTDSAPPQGQAGHLRL